MRSWTMAGGLVASVMLAAVTLVGANEHTAPARNGPAAAKNVCVHFRSNPMCDPLPARKVLSPFSGDWAALLFAPGRDYLQHIQVSDDPKDRDDGSEPLDELPVGAAAVEQALSCDRMSYSRDVCARTRQNGARVRLPVHMVPAGNSDHHYSWNDEAARGEHDLWLAPDLGPPKAAMRVGGAGFCAWSGNGTDCSGSTATRIATSLGGIDPGQLRRAENDPHGTLPYAIGVAALCADPSFVFPATASDGGNTDGSPPCVGHTGKHQRPPLGTRGYIDKSDADINATSNRAYVRVILRTMDREHYGFTLTDTNWSGAPGLAPQYRKGDWGFARSEAGVPDAGSVRLPVTHDGIDLVRDIKFCMNGTCRANGRARSDRRAGG